MRQRLLLADTESWAVEAVSSAARAHGLELIQARSGPEAVEAFIACAPEFVYLDGILPVMDGAQVARRIRLTLSGSAVPILLALALPEPDPESLRRANGLSAIIAKPFSALDISKLLETWTAVPAAAGETLELPAGGEHGELPDRPAAARLLAVTQAGQSGRLLLEQDGAVVELLLDHGLLVDVRSSRQRDRWPAWLARDVQLPARRREVAARLSEHAPSSGLEELVELGALKSQEREQVRRRRLVSLGLEALSWDRGRWCWLEQPVAPLEPPIECSGSNLALAALRRLPLPGVLRPHIPEPGCRLRRLERCRELDLTRLEQEIAGLGDGNRSVAEVFALGRLVEIDAPEAVATLIAVEALEALPAERNWRRPPPGCSGVEGSCPSSGELSQLPAARLIAMLWAHQASGILELGTAARKLALHLREGRVVYARSNDPRHLLGEILLSQGAISRQEHDHALAARIPRTRIGALLVSHGALTLAELHAGLVQQLREIVAAAVRLDEGRFDFLASSEPGDDHIDAGSTPQLILDACRELELTPAHLAAMPADDDLLMRGWDDADLSGHLALSPSERMLLARLASAASIRQLTQLPDIDMLEMLRALFALLSLGVLVPAHAQAASEASGGDEDFADLRAELETGLLDPGELQLAYQQLADECEQLKAENRQLKRELEALRGQPLANR